MRNRIDDIDELVPAKGMFHQQAMVGFYRHRPEMGMGDVSDEIDFECVWDRQFRLLVEARAARNGINPDRVIPQEGRRHEDLFELRVNAARHVLFSESEEVIHQLQGSYSWGFDWVDESEEGLEDFCGLYDLDGGGSGGTRNGLRWLRDREGVLEGVRCDG